jgi:prefoldin subunit 5
MASGIRGVRPSFRELEALCGEHEAQIYALQQQIASLESDRNQLRHAVEHLIEALRRRGCCDGDASGGSF